MKIDLYFSSSEKMKLNKNLHSHVELNGNFRDNIELLNPVILIESNTLPNYNYCYIEEFNRYYFINSIECIRTNLYALHCEVDVLMSYRESILNLDVILSDTEQNGKNNYLDSDVWVSTVKTKTDILNFQNGLSENGHFILITAGG